MSSSGQDVRDVANKLDMAVSQSRVEDEDVPSVYRSHQKEEERKS